MQIPKSTKFLCDTEGTRSVTRPTSVHMLRPGDIDVIGAIGDSLSVGTGSFSYIIPQLLVGHRGSSWTAGIIQIINVINRRRYRFAFEVF